MKSLLLSLCLIINLISAEKISLRTRGCIRKKLGQEETKLLFSGYKEYRKNKNNASLKEYVINQKPTYADTIDECLEKSKRRYLTKKFKDDTSLLINDAQNLGNKLLKDKDKKNAILEKLKTTNASRAKQVCLNFLNSPNVCQYVVDTLAKEVSK